jgi:hypothetical protein
MTRESLPRSTEVYPQLATYVAKWFESHTTLRQESERPAIRSAWCIDGGFVEVWAGRPVQVIRAGSVRSFIKLPGKRMTGVMGLASEQRNRLKLNKTEQTKLRQWKLLLQSIVFSEWEANEGPHNRAVGEASKKWLAATAKHLQASGILLCDSRCRFMGADSSRFALECALKLLWIHFKNFTEEQFLRKHNGPEHNLKKLLDGAPPVLSPAVSTMVELRLQDFPEVGNRYHDPYIDTERLWRCYECAMQVAEEATRQVMDDVYQRSSNN